jgi:hypothetical protein
MKIDDLYTQLDQDLAPGLTKLSAYASQIIESQQSVSILSARLNQELPLRFHDLQRAFVVNLQSRLGDFREEYVHDLDAKTRIRCFEAKIESSVTEGLAFSSWPEWRPEITPRVQAAAAGCAAAAGVGAGLSLAKAMGFLSIKIPLLLGSPLATMLLFVAIASTASAVAVRPDGLPIVLEHERNKAQKHVDAYLEALKEELTQASRRVAEKALAELDKLRITSNEHPQST